MQTPRKNTILPDLLAEATTEAENNQSPIGETLGDRVAIPAFTGGEIAAVAVAQSVDGEAPRLVTRGESSQLDNSL